jgi:hypothetical protein
MLISAESVVRTLIGNSLNEELCAVGLVKEL